MNQEKIWEEEELVNHMNKIFNERDTRKQGELFAKFILETIQKTQEQILREQKSSLEHQKAKWLSNVIKEIENWSILEMDSDIKCYDIEELKSKLKQQEAKR